jgi:hypothetical protein
MKRKRPIVKRAGWKKSPLKPLTREGKKRRAEYLRGWNTRLGQLLFAEAERR